MQIGSFAFAFAHSRAPNERHSHAWIAACALGNSGSDGAMPRPQQGSMRRTAARAAADSERRAAAAKHRKETVASTYVAVACSRAGCQCSIRRAAVASKLASHISRNTAAAARWRWRCRGSVSARLRAASRTGFGMSIKAIQNNAGSTMRSSRIPAAGAARVAETRRSRAEDGG
eukprot:scaffold31964_cov129-Isochrysis_galbana.AAC.1